LEREKGARNSRQGMASLETVMMGGFYRYEKE